MSITCPSCGYTENPEGIEFCEVCGFELDNLSSESLESFPVSIETPNIPLTDRENIAPPAEFNTEDDFILPLSESPATAKLIAKLATYPIAEFILDSPNMIIGRFDPDTGPVDIDLEGFPGEDTISRNHAEIYQEGNQWKVKDLGSMNGVFIRKAGETRFSARLTNPEVLNSGDELAIAKIRFVFKLH